MSTRPAVHSERDGATISITNTDVSDHYQETLIVAASSGVIQTMIGGVAGQTRDVTVDYDVQRGHRRRHPQRRLSTGTPSAHFRHKRA